jgi:hypothetical protein
MLLVKRFLNVARYARFVKRGLLSTDYLCNSNGNFDKRSFVEYASVIDSLTKFYDANESETE